MRVHIRVDLASTQTCCGQCGPEDVIADVHPSATVGSMRDEIIGDRNKERVMCRACCMAHPMVKESVKGTLMEFEDG